MAEIVEGQALPDGIFSLLDTDLYKLTMQCAILKYLPDVHVTYSFTNRTPNMRLNRAAFQWLQEQINSMRRYCHLPDSKMHSANSHAELANISLTDEELDYLKNSCTFFNDAYLRFLTSFCLLPSDHVRVTFTPLKDTGSADDVGDVHLDIGGPWLDTILYEIPLLALTSEAYFKFCDRDWTYKHQESRAYDKGCKLLQHGCVFSEFGSRRRRDYHTQDVVMQGLTRAAADAGRHGWKGKLSGTSNVHFAMRYGIPPVGTVAHEWFMGIASITNDYEHANETAMRYWTGCFGEGVLGIALTDTFGTPTFLKAFRRTMPTPANSVAEDSKTLIPGAASAPLSPTFGDRDGGSVEERSYAQIFQGVRQDSGNPIEYVKIMRDFYDSEGIKEKKTIVFSDSLNIELCVEYMHAAEEAGFAPTFGVGTFLTNDFSHESNGQKSAPLNIVIKLSSANGHPAIKISDNIGKNTGDSETVHKVKETLGYIEKQWIKGDERSRWGGAEAEATKAVVQERRLEALSIGQDGEHFTSQAAYLDLTGHHHYRTISLRWSEKRNVSSMLSLAVDISLQRAECRRPASALRIVFYLQDAFGNHEGLGSFQPDIIICSSAEAIGKNLLTTIMSLVRNFLYLIWSQLAITLPYPQTPATGQTVIVTGSNVGLGLEAARHYLRLGAAKVILAVRSIEKGEAAKQAIEESENRSGVVEVWQLDLQSYESVKQFAQRVNRLPRLDIMLDNAGLATYIYRQAEEDESTITVNVVSTFLLALLLLPKLRETSTRFNTTPCLTIVTSEGHCFTTLPERRSPNIFKELSDEKTADMPNRYHVSKLLEVFYCRELAPRMNAGDKPNVTLNFVTPGLSHSELARETGWSVWFLKLCLARTTEAGSRNFLWATHAGPESHGKYIANCRIEP
ncbi:MAG: hypothetical protein Q9210_003961 [Variospora velana]